MVTYMDVGNTGALSGHLIGDEILELFIAASSTVYTDRAYR